MKTSVMRNQEKRFIYLLPLIAFSILSVVKATAQTMLTDTSAATTPWYTAWWMWAGLILFILVLAGISNTGRRM